MYEQLALGTPAPERESSETQRCLKSLGFAANIVAGAPMSKAGGGLAGALSGPVPGLIERPERRPGTRRDRFPPRDREKPRIVNSVVVFQMAIILLY